MRSAGRISQVNNFKRTPWKALECDLGLSKFASLTVIPLLDIPAIAPVEELEATVAYGDLVINIINRYELERTVGIFVPIRLRVDINRPSSVCFHTAKKSQCPEMGFVFCIFDHVPFAYGILCG